MKKWKKRAGALLAAGVLGVSLAACSPTESSSGTASTTAAATREISNMSAEQVIAEVQKAQDAVTTNAVAMQANIQLGMSMGQESMAMNGVMDIQVQENPMRMRMAMDLESAGMTETVEMYMDVSDDGSTGNLYMQQGGQWYKMHTSDMSTFQAAMEDSYAQSADVDAYFGDDIDLYTNKGTQTVNGKETVLLEAVFSGQDMIDMMEQTGTMEQVEQQFSTLGMNAADLFGQGSMTVGVYVDTETLLPVRMSIDMTEWMQGAMDNLMGSLTSMVSSPETAISIDNYRIDMDITGWGEEVKVEVPSSVLGAQDLGEIDFDSLQL